MNTNFERYHQSVISGIILIQVVSFDIINDRGCNLNCVKACS